MYLIADEVEKAAPEVLQVLLQVMDDGRLTGATGKAVDFTNVVLLMTSNLGAAKLDTAKIGFGDKKHSDADIKQLSNSLHQSLEIELMRLLDLMC